MKKFSNIKVIIFDFDGTLIDSVPDLAASVNFMLQKLQKAPLSQELIRSFVGNGAEMLIKRALFGAKEFDEAFIEKELFSRAKTIFLEHYHKNVCQKTKLYDGVAKTLSKLKQSGYKLAIVTNKPSKFIEPILEHLKIKEYFELWLGADATKQKKPHPEPLLNVCEYFGVDVNEAVMIGDSKNDIEAAKACGMQSIGVSYGYNYDEDISLYNPEVVVDNFEKLCALFECKERVAIVGGGVAGSSVALLLAKNGVDTTLFEAKESLVDGPPMCHLHAGGNLYREIDDAQCLQLLEESIEFAKLYPQAIDPRPTVLAIPKHDDGSVDEVVRRLEFLQRAYAALVQKDSKNSVLGDPKHYFKLYSKEEIIALKSKKQPKAPQSFDDWMVGFAKIVDLKAIKYPVAIVSEYGINLFRLAAISELAAKSIENLELNLQTKVVDVVKEEDGFWVAFEQNGTRANHFYDYLVNAAGFASGVIDDMLGYHKERFVEFKAAYVTKWKEAKEFVPEIIFHGKRGTPKGMAQFTPYNGGYVQLHGMTKEITLFEDGLVKNSSLSAQPALPQKLHQKIYVGWSKESVDERTSKAIEYMSEFIPSFQSAEVASKPLYGAQQIPGSDAELRAAEVSFEGDRYARCEIVKANSVTQMSKAIAKKFFQKELFLEGFVFENEQIDQLASVIASKRGYPKEMGRLLLN